MGQASKGLTRNFLVKGSSGTRGGKDVWRHLNKEIPCYGLPGRGLTRKKWEISVPKASSKTNSFFFDFGLDLGGSWRGLGTNDWEIRGQKSDLR